MKTKEPKEIELPFTSEKFSQIWQEWLTYRKEERFPAYKPTGLRRTLSGLVRDSNGDEESAIRIIINAMEKTWRGLFPHSQHGTTTNRQDATKLGASAARTEAARNF